MVTLYSQPLCQPCRLTAKRLTAAGIEYTVINVQEDPDAVKFLQEMGYNRTPVVIVDMENHWSGYKPDFIEKLKK